MTKAERYAEMYRNAPSFKLKLDAGALCEVSTEAIQLAHWILDTFEKEE